MHMGWLWLVGPMKLLVSFAKEPYKRDDILQKRPIIWSILLTVATAYHTNDRSPQTARTAVLFFSFSIVFAVSRPIGCLKLQVMFCKRATNYRALLRKMTCQDKASYDSAPPCIIAFGVSINFNLQSQSHWSLFNGTWQKRPREQGSPLED